MADLLTTATLAKWTQNDPAEVAADEFAVDLIDKVSQLICFIGGHDGTKIDPVTGDAIEEWTLDSGPDQAPIDVQMVALQVIKRSYENPGQVIQEGSVGPLGGDRVADVQALFMDFTDSERATLSKYNIDGDPTTQDGAGEVFTLQTTRGSETTMPQTSPLYVGDNLQINLESSADPREWKIPLFNPGDPGDDSLYDE
jgi:hypothetical protein